MSHNLTKSNLVTGKQPLAFSIFFRTYFRVRFNTYYLFSNFDLQPFYNLIFLNHFFHRFKHLISLLREQSNKREKTSEVGNCYHCGPKIFSLYEVKKGVCGIHHTSLIVVWTACSRTNKPREPSYTLQPNWDSHTRRLVTSII